MDEGRVAISLGTSDTIFGLMREPRVDPTGTGHVSGAPTGDYMGITVFKNGSLARERIRDAFGLTWPEFSSALAATPPGNHGRIPSRGSNRRLRRTCRGPASIASD